MTPLEKQLQQLKQQVNDSPWLKWAGLLIALLLAALVLQALDGLRLSQQKASIDAELNLRRILALKGQDTWLVREKEATQLRDSLQAQLPEVATPGMAQAALQNWLQTITAGFNSNKNASLRINHAAPLESMPNILKVNAALNGEYGPRQLLALLRQIESAPNLVVVETLHFQNDTTSTAHLTLNAYYQLSTEEVQ